MFPYPSSRSFLVQFARSPRTIGALVPSSRALSETMLAPIDFARASTIVEFGPGTGAFTRMIADRKRPDCRYLGIELNHHFVGQLTARFPGLGFVHGSVVDLGQILRTQRIATVDAIVSGLPWASLPVSMQQAVFTEIDAALGAGGVFVTFAYLHGLALPGAVALRRHLRRHFADVRRSRPVWANVPPAVAYFCHKAGPMAETGPASCQATDNQAISRPPGPP